MEEVHTNGGYDNEGVIWHQHSNHLMKKILEYFPKDIPVIDLGCGHNFYVSVLNYFGYKSSGYDVVDLGSIYYIYGDLTKEMNWAFETGDKKSNVISLEVGEHIPESFSNTYLNNVTRFGSDVIMSWAVPGQAGIGHINCKPNSWVISEMANRGFILDQTKTDSLREAVKHCHCSWFQNTLMYFTCKK
jgi:hypothetical protein